MYFCLFLFDYEFTFVYILLSYIIRVYKIGIRVMQAYIKQLNLNEIEHCSIFNGYNNEQKEILIYFTAGARQSEIADIMNISKRKIAYQLMEIAKELDTNISGLRLIFTARLLINTIVGLKVTKN